MRRHNNYIIVFLSRYILIYSLTAPGTSVLTLTYQNLLSVLTVEASALLTTELGNLV